MRAKLESSVVIVSIYSNSINSLNYELLSEEDRYYLIGNMRVDYT